MTKLFEKMSKREDRQFLSNADGYELLRRLPFAFVVPRDGFYDYLKASLGDDELCKLRELRILNHGIPSGFPIQKRSPFEELFNSA